MDGKVRAKDVTLALLVTALSVSCQALFGVEDPGETEDPGGEGGDDDADGPGASGGGPSGGGGDAGAASTGSAPCECVPAEAGWSIPST